jgi:hypothetical protein
LRAPIRQYNESKLVRFARSSRIAMTTASDIDIVIDDRLRLIGALLAATTWPDEAQRRRPHGTHAHARATRKQVTPFRGHPAAIVLQALLDRGIPLEAIYATAVSDAPKPEWLPADWPTLLRDFHAHAGLAAWWRSEAADWEASVEAARRVFVKVCLKPFFVPFFGDISARLAFMPNLLYPGERELGIAGGDTLLALIPPPLAWGDSPPWPYDEDPAHTVRVTVAQFAHLLTSALLEAHAADVADATPFTDTARGRMGQAYAPEDWPALFRDLFVPALTALYLEEAFSPGESKAYVLMERRTHKLDSLDTMIALLRDFRARQRDEAAYSDFGACLRDFPSAYRALMR